jgi:hypothetical protein
MQRLFERRQTFVNLRTTLFYFAARSEFSAAQASDFPLG